MDIIDLAIGLMITAAVIPQALGTFHSANTTGFTPAELLLWGLIGLLVIVAIIKQIMGTKVGL